MVRMLMPLGQNQKKMMSLFYRRILILASRITVVSELAQRCLTESFSGHVHTAIDEVSD
jgi:hypothetical protein